MIRKLIFSTDMTLMADTGRITLSAQAKCIPFEIYFR